MIPFIVPKSMGVAANGTKKYFIGMIDNFKISFGNAIASSCGEGDFTITGFDYINSASEPRDVAIHGSHVVNEYNDLVNKANVIALIKVKDELSKSNSTIVYQENTPFIQYHYATREVEVLEYYKNDLDLGANIKFNEPAAITADNDYIHDEEYTTFQKGKKYIVYLSTNNGLGELGLISRNNGKINLDNFTNNEYKDVAVKSILKADNITLPDNAIINYDVPQDKKVNNQNDKVKKVNNKDIELSIYYRLDEKSNVEYLNIGGIDLSINSPI